MIVEKMKVISIDKENLTFLCDNGIEYPLMEGCENMSVSELQHFINEANSTVQSIVDKIIDNDEQ
ncbi:MAG: hypothetical protein IKR66_04635 [Bacteroidales bacterium]|nr:hypothetical protein [Bacteroidales bacterium]